LRLYYSVVLTTSVLVEFVGGDERHDGFSGPIGTVAIDELETERRKKLKPQSTMETMRKRIRDETYRLAELIGNQEPRKRQVWKFQLKRRWN